ncbi:MAG: thiamine pyrophosphate-binding protein [Betaproteobacteria bacterium]|nr:thiamine pyrophosphate-binding protein [Betaproteobacteria bacterium]
MTGGQALVQQFKREGIDTIFGLPGIQLDWVFDALHEERAHFKLYHPRHEQACVYMADGYARASGRIAVALMVPGPGLLNAAGALSTAYAVSSPVFVVTGNIESKNIDRGKGLLHEIRDQLGMIAHVTKYQALARSPSEIPGLVHEAMRQLQTGRPRPVEIEVPPDVTEAKAQIVLIDRVQHERPGPDPDLIEKAARLLGAAKKPLIFAGGGVISGSACAELLRVAELLESPVIQSANGKGAVSDRHPLSLPLRAMSEVGPDTDVVLLVGTRFVQGLMSQVLQPWVNGKTIIHLDIDPSVIGSTYPTTVGIVSDVKKGLAALAESLEKHNIKRASRREDLVDLKRFLDEDARRQSPQADYAHAIREALPDDGAFVQESTQVGYWAGQAFPVYQPRTYFTSGYQGTLGYGFATALGVQVGMPGRKVVSINGDGGFAYNVMELATMVEQKIPLTAIVFNDNAYGNVKRIQEMRFGGRTIASDLHNPDMMKLAEAYGVEGRRVKSPAELKSTLLEVFKRNEPVLIEAPVGPMPPVNFKTRAQAQKPASVST